jgi:mitochondrial inner membrane protease ATP23
MNKKDAEQREEIKMENALKAEKRKEKIAALCQKNLHKLLKNNKPTIELLDKLQKFECELPEGMIKCDPCLQHGAINGGYQPAHFDEEGKLVQKSIILCETKLNRSQMEKTLRHELIHAFDDCTTNLDW